MNKAGRKKSKTEGWRKVKLENVVEINPPERIPQGTKAKKVNMDALIPFTRKIPKYVNETYKSGSKFRNGDTLLARITPCLENGKTALVDFLAPGEVGFGSTEFIIMREKRDITNKDFLYHFARSGNFRNMAIKSMTGSSGRQRVEINEVKQYKFYLPPLAEQEAIAEVLSSLDDKIDLLHRQNKTLEDMAQTLFRQWFIEEANEEWEEIKLGDIAIFHYGKSLTKQNRVDGDIPVFSSAGLVGFHNKALTDTPGIIIGRKGTVGKVYYSKTPFYCIDTAFYILPSDKYSLEFLFYLLLALNLDELNEDSAVPGLNRDTAYRQKVFLPPMELMKRFESAVKPLFNKIKSNQHSIYSLMNLRDTLLPKLISGKVSVRP